ncbi:MAG: energy-coupling factor transporter transmembrane protein EcfT [Sedimentibacter sp.]
MTINSKIDPRTKLVMVLVLSTISLIYNDILTLITILSIALLCAFAMKSDLVAIFVRIKKIIRVMLAIAIVQSLFTKAGNPLIRIGNITIITDYGIVKSLEFMLRLGIIIASAAIITTSSSREIVQGLVQWHCPYEIAFMVSVSIRFLPIFKEEMTDMITAIQLRGIDLKKIKVKEKIKIYNYILFPVVTNSILKAKELSSAMEMRGFRAYNSRTSYMVLKMQNNDYAIIAITLVFVLLLFIIKII